MVTGNLDIVTMKKLYAQLEKFTNAVFHTDDWNAFAAVLPKDRHKIGKRYTNAIERHNSNTRHHLSRMNQRTKVVSHCPTMLELAIWQADF
jgi:insertion element IS1 protein InsB